MLGVRLSVPPARPRTALLWALLLAAPAAPGSLAGSPVQVRIVAPAADEVVEGSTAIEAEVFLPDGMGVLKVDFYVDGQRIGWRDEPPYRLAWDAGDSLRARRIRVVAYASDGLPYEATMRTREIRVDYRERVSVVNVFATVRDFGGDYAGNLDVDDFRILEDGAPQTISHFAYENLPLHVVFLVDASLSMRGDRIVTAREAAERFAQSLDFERDRAMVIDFAGTPIPRTALTDRLEEVLGAVRGLDARPGGTALYDAVVAAVEALRAIEGRKAVVLLSDGRDESDDGLSPGSARSFEEALARAHQADVIVYSIGVGRDIREQKDFYGTRTVEQVLTRFADETGGRAFFAARVGQLRRAYENVADALRHQYSLGYSSTNHRRDGSWREIEVRCLKDGYTVTARKGYYAPAS